MSEVYSVIKAAMELSDLQDRMRATGRNQALIGIRFMEASEEELPAIEAECQRLDDEGVAQALEMKTLRSKIRAAARIDMQAKRAKDEPRVDH